MRAIIFPLAIVLTKAHRAAVSTMAKGCIVALILPLRCFLISLPNYTNILVCFAFFSLFSEEPEVLIREYSQTAILHAAHFQQPTLCQSPIPGNYHQCISVIYSYSAVCDSVNPSAVSLTIEPTFYHPERGGSN